MELTDIINEAQQGWRRDEKGLTLEISKVMSHEHLAGSKATNWYHAGPVMSGYFDTLKSRGVNQTSLPHSLSDGHLLYAAAKVDAELEKIRSERAHNVAGKGRSKSESNSTKRNIYDNPSCSFYVIPEVSYEDEHVADNADSDNNEDDIDDAEAKAIMDYRNVIRRLSKTLSNESVGTNDSKIDTVDEDSLASAGQDNPGFEPDDSDLDNTNGDIVFTLGATSPSTEHGPTLFESDDSDFQNCGVRTRLADGVSFAGINRLISDDHGYLSANGSDTGSPTDNVNTSLKYASNADSTTDSKKNGKDKRFRVFRGFRKSKKTSKDGTCNSENTSSNDKTQDGGSEGNEQEHHSDADSDGFVDEEFDDNKGYITIDITDIDKSKKKGIIPINENEDVNCIY